MTTIHYLAKAVKKWDLEAIQFLEFTITDYQENVYVHIDTLTAVAGVIVDEEDMRNANSFAKDTRANSILLVGIN